MPMRIGNPLRMEQVENLEYTIAGIKKYFINPIYKVYEAVLI
jgi:hypothetical protein